MFEAKDAPNECQFRYMLAMEPMPEREERLNGGLLSHLHFQYASRLELLFKDGKLNKQMCMQLCAMVMVNCWNNAISFGHYTEFQNGRSCRMA